MNVKEWVSDLDLSTDFGKGFDTYRWVDGVAFSFSPATEVNDGLADGLGGDGFNIAGLFGIDFYLDRGDVPVFGLKYSLVAALGDDPLAHFFEGGPGFDGEERVGENARAFEGCFCEVEAEVAESASFFTFEDANCFFDFERVSCSSS